MPGTGNLVKVKGIMKEEGYVKILKENFKQSAAKLTLGHRPTTSLMVKNYSQKIKVNITNWPS